MSWQDSIIIDTIVKWQNLDAIRVIGTLHYSHNDRCVARKMGADEGKRLIF